MRLAWFVSPHGFGHAARQAALIAALRARRPALEVELFTRVPASFFKDSHVGPFVYHELDCDLGLVQRSPIEEDLPATLTRLAERLPFDPALVQRLASLLYKRSCRGVICDIAPLGLAVAKAAGLPSLLVENFTWDWIYAGYVPEAPEIAAYVRLMREAFALADWRVQAEPPCEQAPGADAAGVISRAAHTPRDVMRRQLGLRAGVPMVLITGGILDGTRDEVWQVLSRAPGFDFVLVGGTEPQAQRAHVHYVPAHSAFYHPDLVYASDAVVAKLGYSTVAECYQAGTRMAYLTRARFRESPVLERFVRAHLPALALEAGAWLAGTWIDGLPGLLAQPSPVMRPENGAHALADQVLERWG